MVQWLAKHVIRTHKQSGSCVVESPQSRDRPTTLYYVTRPFSFPAPTQKKEKGLATRD